MQQPARVAVGLLPSLHRISLSLPARSLSRSCHCALHTVASRLSLASSASASACALTALSSAPSFVRDPKRNLIASLPTSASRQLSLFVCSTSASSRLPSSLTRSLHMSGAQELRRSLRRRSTSFSSSPSSSLSSLSSSSPSSCLEMRAPAKEGSPERVTSSDRPPCECALDRILREETTDVDSAFASAPS
mmetsp:Transcript_2853/g.8942  ORF Transcript_2853/g.8942 Transcript_2853/m.8942 type:complete len:191 (-) Transcript_2853:1422-1994(-)